jgi:hypothetical protein
MFREIPKDFNINIYKLLNNDLKDFNDEELINHYLIHGINENREYNLSKNFNTNIYKLLNNDLKDFNDEELINHYLKYGINENRVYSLPENFNTSIYKLLNNDLKNLNDEELIYHYLIYGINENRCYKYDLPENFDTSSYKLFNKDLNDLNEKELINHYLLYGKIENRVYKCYLTKDLIDNINLNYFYINVINNTNILLNNDDYRNTVYFTGGLCNMLFQISAIISFSYDNNTNFYLNYDIDDRKSCVNKLFKNITFRNNTTACTYNETNYKYNKITINPDQNILFKGYFQSYKYFWHNINVIKSYFNFEDKIVFWLKYKKFILDTESKKLLGIHIRLTDYVKSSETHINMQDSYYKKALSTINLQEYKVILFTDDIINASKILNNIGINDFIFGDYLNNDDLEQLLLLSVTDVRICVNSTYSLWSCYINDMYELNNEAFYIFPDLWFGPEGPEYNLYDLIPENNNKYKIINVYKCAVIFFHKNIYNIYNKYWIEKCRDSIINQINVFFDIYEVNYGNEDKSIFDNYNFPKKINKYFYKKNYKTHTEAMMFLLNKCFNEHNYDIVFNTNLDDYYNDKRFIYQIYEVNKNNSLLNSTMWTYIKQKNEYEEIDIIHEEKISINHVYPDQVKNEMFNFHNLINHSGVCFTKKFWNSTDKYNNKLKYRNDKPYEDLSLWYRAFENNIKITVINKNLIDYRIHNSQIGSILQDIKKTGIKKKTFCEGPILIDYQVGILLDTNFNDINKIEQINKNIFPDREKYYFLYVNKKDELNIKNYLEDLNILYDIIFYNDKLENYEEIIKLFDVSVELNSDYLFIVKNLDIDFIIDNFNIHEDYNYKLIKV